MGDKTKIQWTDATWNPVTGCSRVSPGCEHCFAERQALGRLKGKKGYPGLPWTKVNAPTNVVLHPDRFEIPLRAKRPRKYFVNTMSDLLHEQVPNEYIAALFGVMAATPRHTYQILTKRPERMIDWFRWVVEQDSGVRRGEAFTTPGRLECCWQALAHEVEHHEKGDSGPLHVEHSADPSGPWPLPNVHLGISAEDQKRLDERAPDLLATPAAVRFVSAEPLLEPLSFTWLPVHDGNVNALRGSRSDDFETCGVPRTETSRLDWVIVGGESGPGARPMDIAWARDIIRQCSEAGVAVFVKQLGANVFDSGRTARGESETVHLQDPKGGDMDEWPEDLRVREMPSVP